MATKKTFFWFQQYMRAFRRLYLDGKHEYGPDSPPVSLFTHKKSLNHAQKSLIQLNRAAIYLCSRKPHLFAHTSASLNGVHDITYCQSCHDRGWSLGGGLIWRRALFLLLRALRKSIAQRVCFFFVQANTSIAKRLV